MDEDARLLYLRSSRANQICAFVMDVSDGGFWVLGSTY
jgi:hypothetical protein